MKSGRTIAMDGKEYPYPEIGQDVYVNSSFYIDHGRDDFRGGLCCISEIIDRFGDDTNILDYNRLFIVVKERPGWKMNWFYLWDQQDVLRQKFGDIRGYEDPDMDPAFNTE